MASRRIRGHAGTTEALVLGFGIGLGIGVFEVLRTGAARLLARHRVFDAVSSASLTSPESLALEKLSSDLHNLTSRLSRTCDRVETWLDCASDSVDSDELDHLSPERSSQRKLIETFHIDPNDLTNPVSGQDADSTSDDPNSLEQLFSEYDRIEEADGGSNRTLRHKILDDILAREEEILARKDSNGMWHLAAAYFHKATKGGELIDGPASSNISDEDKAKMQAELEHGIEFAKAAGDDCWQGHKWIAIFSGILSKFDPIKQKILRAHEYKTHILRAIELNPQDPSCHYLYGRWSFEVAGTSWLTRKAAAALFAEVPSASYEDCLLEFREAHRVSNGNFWRSNSVYIAKCYLKLNEVDKARFWLEKAIEKSATGSLDDQKYLKLAQELLREL
eukprot:m.883265 g.883265  ORF g.883265 m.883265 type:complete len:392 (+) comp23605_c0_seq2:62-1237(+)